MKIRLVLALNLFCMATFAQSAPFDKGNAESGKKMFEQHKCNSCHIRLLGGDGNGMFTRAERKVKSPASLRTQISSCSTNLGLMLFEDDEENLGAYLNNNFYKFK